MESIKKFEDKKMTFKEMGTVLGGISGCACYDTTTARCGDHVYEAFDDNGTLLEHYVIYDDCLYAYTTPVLERTDLSAKTASSRSVSVLEKI